MKPERIETGAAREWSWNAIELRWRVGDSFANPVTFSRIEPGSFVQPAMLISPDDAQQMMDELWRCGIRPTEAAGSAGSMAATERHLADMRSIALGRLRKQGVKA